MSCADALPWAVVPAWHTLQLLLNGSELSEAALRAAVHLTPTAAAAPAALAAAAPPRAPHRLEWRVTLPPYGSALLSLQLRRPLLPVEALPSDASRGLDLGAAAVRYRVHVAHRPAARPTAAAAAAAPGSIPAAAEAPRLLFTESALLQLPLADQSMPFNVISLTSTIVALFAGSMFNLLTRRHMPHGGRAPVAEKAGRTHADSNLKVD